MSDIDDQDFCAFSKEIDKMNQQDGRDNFRQDPEQRNDDDVNPDFIRYKEIVSFRSQVNQDPDEEQVYKKQIKNTSKPLDRSSEAFQPKKEIKAEDEQEQEINLPPPGMQQDSYESNSEGSGNNQTKQTYEDQDDLLIKKSIHLFFPSQNKNQSQDQSPKNLNGHNSSDQVIKQGIRNGNEYKNGDTIKNEEEKPIQGVDLESQNNKDQKKQEQDSEKDNDTDSNNLRNLSDSPQPAKIPDAWTKPVKPSNRTLRNNSENPKGTSSSNQSTTTQSRSMSQDNNKALSQTQRGKQQQQKRGSQKVGSSSKGNSPLKKSQSQDAKYSNQDYYDSNDGNAEKNKDQNEWKTVGGGRGDSGQKYSQNPNVSPKQSSKLNQQGPLKLKLADKITEQSIEESKSYQQLQKSGETPSKLEDRASRSRYSHSGKSFSVGDDRSTSPGREKSRIDEDIEKNSSISAEGESNSEPVIVDQVKKFYSSIDDNESEASKKAKNKEKNLKKKLKRKQRKKQASVQGSNDDGGSKSESHNSNETENQLSQKVSQLDKSNKSEDNNNHSKSQQSKEEQKIDATTFISAEDNFNSQDNQPESQQKKNLIQEKIQNFHSKHTSPSDKFNHQQAEEQLILRQSAQKATVSSQKNIPQPQQISSQLSKPTIAKKSPPLQNNQPLELLSNQRRTGKPFQRSNHLRNPKQMLEEDKSISSNKITYQTLDIGIKQIQKRQKELKQINSSYKLCLIGPFQPQYYNAVKYVYPSKEAEANQTPTFEDRYLSQQLHTDFIPLSEFSEESQRP